MTEARWLDRAALATYICVDKTAIPRLVRTGRLPPPDMTLGPRQPRWDRQKVDAKFNGGVTSADPRQAVAALAETILAAPRRPRRPLPAR